MVTYWKASNDKTSNIYGQLFTFLTSLFRFVVRYLKIKKNGE